MALDINCEDLLNEFRFKADDRSPPDIRCRAQFRQGWQAATDGQRDEYSTTTLKKLTWRNLGYRLGQKLGNAYLDEIDIVYDQFAVHFHSQYAYENPADRDYPTFEMYKEALLKLKAKINDRQMQILKAHYQSDGYLTTAPRLAEQLELDDLVHINREYGRLASMLAKELGIFIPSDWVRLNAIATCIGEAPIQWLLHTQVVQALHSLGWFSQGKSLLQDLEAEELTQPNILDTTRRTIIESRIGQGTFRSNLILYWKGYAVTRCLNLSILKASHIKPWRVSTNEERLDHYNGLLLIPNLDTLFDQGLITFADSGEILVSGKLIPEDRLLLGIANSMHLSKIEDRHKAYLAYHRDNIFQS